MATLEDKILGEKSQYYCSSSSEDEDDSTNSDEGNKASAPEMPPKQSSMEFSDWDGTSSNTGPKGVIRVSLYSNFLYARPCNLLIKLCTYYTDRIGNDSNK